MATGTDIYLAARELVGTPYLHQGRKKDLGIDCAGVPIWTLQRLGLGDFDVSNYPRNPNGTMIKEIESCCQKIELQPGALLVFKVSAQPQHCGIVSNYMNSFGLIHAWDICNQVCEHRLIQQWLDRIVGCYGLPGVDYD